jgi:hypothetical protein
MSNGNLLEGGGGVINLPGTVGRSSGEATYNSLLVYECRYRGVGGLWLLICSISSSNLSEFLVGRRRLIIAYPV